MDPQGDNKETTMADTRPVPVRPAAVVVLARSVGEQLEVFMVRRHVQSEFVPDAFVFPGGSVKEADVAAEQMDGLSAPVPDSGPTKPTRLGTGFRVAAIRECFEEAGVLLASPSRSPLASVAVSEVERQRLAGYRDDLNNRRISLIQIAEKEGLVLATDELLHWAHWITPAAPPRKDGK
jgi:8-oxo-dGTP pyrophosphatase MutT (NUDIX family)